MRLLVYEELIHEDQHEKNKDILLSMQILEMRLTLYNVVNLRIKDGGRY